MHYALRVQGHLDPGWSDRLGGLRIEQQEAGTTLLSGSVPDQAALHGLLSLETSEAKGAEEAADRRPAESLDAESSQEIEWWAGSFHLVQPERRLQYGRTSENS